ncbi:Uma2 family endonuclease [Nocardia amikacinitolerans]|uniref:Uma2 family endonuclease n=1 Tax=Nocardia amikacinitolerans TaxID=756689 RepID=UPI003557117B
MRGRGADGWTAADLDHMPENGLRYEVLNGQLVVGAPVSPRHQWLIKWLGRALDDVKPDGFEVLDGVGVLVGEDEPIPDLIVVTGPIDWDGRGIPVEHDSCWIEWVRFGQPVMSAAWHGRARSRPCRRPVYAPGI